MLAAIVACALLTLAPAPAGAIEDYPAYQPPTKCAPKPKPGAKQLGRWLVKKYGGGYGPISRKCDGSPSYSEHTEGRAFDWTLDAAKKRDRQRAKRFLARAFATDARDNTHALARRMGIMYVIWNDRMYPSWNHYAPEPYLSPVCPSIDDCSKTQRHRDHLHVSLSRQGGKAKTSWYQ